MFNMQGRKKVAFFIIEVLIPIILAPVLPYFFNNCSAADAFIIGSCISVFLAVWDLGKRLDSQKDEMDVHGRDTKRGFDDVRNRMEYIEAYLDFEKEIEKVSNPYFRKRINNALRKNLVRFKEEYRELVEGHVTTSPYSNETYGVEGLKYTTNELLAVSSIDDYWDRKGFVSEYLKTQFNLIAEHSIVIKRIFIGTKDKLHSAKPLMKMQMEGGIEVYYIESDSGFCKPEWCKEDFLIQDKQLLVDLKVSSHTSEASGTEIITVRDIEVNDKIELFNILLANATKFQA